MAVGSHGTLLRIRDELGAYATVSEVNDIEGMGATSEVEVVHSDDPQEHPVVLSSGIALTELSFEINYIGSETQQRLRDAATSRELLAFLMEFPTNPVETAAFSGMVTRFTTSAPVAGVIRASVAVTLTSYVEYDTQE